MREITITNCLAMPSLGLLNPFSLVNIGIEKKINIYEILSPILIQRNIKSQKVLNKVKKRKREREKERERA